MENGTGRGSVGPHEKEIDAGKSSIGARIGLFLFRYRSFTPLPLLGLCVWVFRPYLWANLVLQGLSGLMLALAGLCIRFVAIGYARKGTSGRENYLRAEALNTDGIYRWVRNPLYWGNILLFAGLLVTYGNLIAFLTGLAYLVIQYHFVILSEESYLRKVHGQAYQNYCQSIRRWIPRVGGRIKGERVWSWRRILARENDAIFNVWILWWGVMLWHKELIRPTGNWLHSAACVLGVGLLFYVSVKIWKRKPGIRELAG